MSMFAQRVHLYCGWSGSGREGIEGSEEVEGSEVQRCGRPAGSPNPARPGGEPARPSRTFPAPRPRSRTGCAQGPPGSETALGRPAGRAELQDHLCPRMLGAVARETARGMLGSREAAQPRHRAEVCSDSRGGEQGAGPAGPASLTGPPPPRSVLPSAQRPRAGAPAPDWPPAGRDVSPETSCSRCQVRGFRCQRRWAPAGF